MNTRSHTAPARTLPAVAVACLFLALGLSSCGPSSPPPSARDSQPAQPLATYSVRGVVIALPDPSRKGSPDLEFHHEAIPQLKDRDGNVVGMGEMTMPFPLADGVSLEGVKVGDKLDVTFVVDWSRAPVHRITAWKMLPDETELDFKK